MRQSYKALGRRELGVAVLGDFLRNRREADDLSVTQMAAKLGVSRPYLGRLERGQIKRPAPEILSRIAKPLNVHLEDLYALAGFILPTDLPAFGPYLHAKHPDWPPTVTTALAEYYEFLEYKYSLN